MPTNAQVSQFSWENKHLKQLKISYQVQCNMENTKGFRLSVYIPAGTDYSYPTEQGYSLD